MLDNYSFEIDSNSLKEKSKAPKNVQNDIPDGALFFKAVASNWDLNRNWYIIRAKAWITWANWKKNLTAINDYLQNWKILFQHNDNQPIWKPLSLKVVWNELILTGWVFDNTHSSWDIWRGLVTSISTWHMTLAREFENVDTWDIQTEEEFFEDEKNSWWDKLWSWLWVMAVTSAEIVENSFVTIPSNRDSHIINSRSYLINKSWVSEDEFNILLSKKNLMNKREIEEMKNVNFPASNWAEDVETDDATTDDVVDETTDKDVEEKVETTDTPKEEEKVDDTPDDSENTPKEENKVKKEEEKAIVITEATIEKLINSAVTSMKNELTKEFDLKMNQIKEDKRNDLKEIVKNAKDDENSDPKQDLKNSLRQD